MPITYSIDHGTEVISEVWTGDISAKDLASHWRQYLSDPEVLAIRKTLVDLRHCNIKFSGQELSDLVTAIVIPALQGRDWKSALLVERPRQYGLSRQYQVFAQSYSRDAIFHDREAALAWLLG